MKIIIKFILKRLWLEYSKDKRVLYDPMPYGRSVLSAEGFIYWLMGWYDKK